MRERMARRWGDGNRNTSIADQNSVTISCAAGRLHSFFVCQLVGQNIRPFSWCERHRDAERLDKHHGMPSQNSHFAFLYRFVGILRLFEDGDPIVEGDDGEDRNLFDFREPKDPAFGRRCPSIRGGLTSDQYTPLHPQRKA
jgi:hypothetical protein